MDRKDNMLKKTIYDFFPDFSTECKMPSVAGDGDERLVRYFYNQTTRECESFIFYGKGGNGNNFLSVSKCERQCKNGKVSSYFKFIIVPRQKHYRTGFDVFLILKSSDMLNVVNQKF